MPAANDVKLPPPPAGTVDILFIAGEHSGDQHGARVVRQLKQLRPELKIAALGGPAIASAGAELLLDLTASSVVGLVEVLKNYSFFKSLFDSTVSWIREYRPRAVCFVDYPGFNLRIAKALFEAGLSSKAGGPVKTLFYISPQIWAWKAGRRFTMAKHLDAMAVIFPFEVECYADTTLRPEFVGHPFLADDYASPVVYDPAGPVLLLPGSRKQAVGRIFPVMLAGYRRYAEASETRAAVVVAPSEEILSILKSAGPPESVELRLGSESDGGGQTRPIKASAVLTSSGTMSMHCALAGIPGAVVYRANPLTYVLGRMLVKVPYLGIANLLLKEPMYPEYIQGAATPDALAGELRDCIHNVDRVRVTSERAARLRSILRQPSASSAAEWVLRELK